MAGTLGRFGLLAVTALATGVLGLGSAQAADTYDIDVIMPLTGGGSFLGLAEQKALQLAEPVLGSVGGKPVHFVFYDDQSNPQNAVQLATQAASRNPPVILGSSLVGMCGAMAPLMSKGPVMYCLSPGYYPKTGSYAYSSSVSTHDMAAALLRYLKTTGKTKLALITSTDASGLDAARQIKALMASDDNKGITLVGEASFNPNDVSASAQIQRLKSADPQALIAWSTGAAVGTVFKAIVDAGWDIPVATTNGNQTFAQMHQYASILPKTLYIPTSQWPESETDLPKDVMAQKKTFYDTFAKAGVKPDLASTLSWDPALIVVSALKKLGPTATADQLRDYISKERDFAGINGIYNFPAVPQRGLDEGAVVVTQWDKDKDNWIVVSKPRGLPLDKK